MSTTTEPQSLLNLFLAYAQKIYHVDRAIVLSRKGLEHPLFRVVLSADCGQELSDMVDDPTDIARSRGILADLLYAGVFRRITPLECDASEPSRDLLNHARELVAFPLYEQGEALDMVVLLGPSDRHCSAPDLCSLAIMGALLQRGDRAHTLTSQLATTCRALDAELAAAASVQQWLLPAPAPLCKDIDVATFYRTAQHCGGDYYDVGPLPGDRIGVLIADVSGHGAAATVLMAILRTIVHDDVDQLHLDSPSALLDHADAHLCSIGLPSRGAFITAFSAVLDTTTGTLVYSCAGHPPPRLLQAADRAVAAITGAQSLPLGITEDLPPREEATIELKPGDLLVFYSDGISEARSPSGEFFGTDRLDRVLRGLPHPVTANAATEAIKQAVTAFAGPGAPADDQTVLAVRWDH